LDIFRRVPNFQTVRAALAYVGAPPEEGRGKRWTPPTPCRPHRSERCATDGCDTFLCMWNRGAFCYACTAELEALARERDRRRGAARAAAEETDYQQLMEAA
jgi:hypothetical protein